MHARLQIQSTTKQPPQSMLSDIPHMLASSRSSAGDGALARWRAGAHTRVGVNSSRATCTLFNSAHNQLLVAGAPAGAADFSIASPSACSAPSRRPRAP